MRKILLIQAHPDPKGGHLCNALGTAYAEGAKDAGHLVRLLRVADLDFNLLKNKKDWLAPVTESLAKAQKDIVWADHVVLVFPLWLGDMPALLKGFLEQILRAGFAFEATGKNGFPRPLLAGRSARVIVTMGMPAWLYRIWFGAPALAILKHHILGFVGFKPVHCTVLGLAEGGGDRRAARQIAKVRALGNTAA